MNHADQAKGCEFCTRAECGWRCEYQYNLRAWRGAYWLGMLGFALAAPAATDAAAKVALWYLDRSDWGDGACDPTVWAIHRAIRGRK